MHFAFKRRVLEFSGVAALVVSIFAAAAGTAIANVVPSTPALSTAVNGTRMSVAAIRRTTISGQFVSPQAQAAALANRSLSLEAMLAVPAARRARPFRSGPFYAQAKRAAITSRVAPTARAFAVNASAPKTVSAVTQAGLAADFDGLANSRFICNCTPPDMALAASPEWVVQAVNTSVGVFSPDGQSQPGYPLQGDAFLGGLPGRVVARCDSRGAFLSDPRAFYDVNDRRFFVIIAQFDGSSIGNPTCPNIGIIWIATSVDSNPSHGWYVYSFDGSDGGANFPDYPRLGFDKSTIEISTTQFGNAAPFSISNETTFVDKAALESGAGPGIAVYSGITYKGTILDTIQPVETLAPPSKQPGAIFNVVSENFFSGGGQCRNGCNKLLVFSFVKPLSPTPTLLAQSLTTPPYAAPPNADTSFCSNCLETIDTRISATPVYSALDGGIISWALGTAVRNTTQVVAGVLWGEIHATLANSSLKASLLQAGYIAENGDIATSFPATAIGTNGTVYIVADRMGRRLVPGNAVYAHRPLDAPGTVQSATVLHSGVVPPVADALELYGNLRWGDYSATSFDGSNVWLAAQYSNGGGDWATTIASRR